MPPAPASIAAAPSPRSSVPWNPAVPPPPLAGAPLGTWLAAGVTVTVSVTVVVFGGGAAGATVAVAVEVTPGVADGEWLPDAEAAAAVRDPVGEVVTDGVKTVGEDEDVDEVQAETATGASRIRAPQQRVVSLAPAGLPAIVPRTFMAPPPAPHLHRADDDCVPGPGARNRTGKKNT
jgi:hypothetical protein